MLIEDKTASIIVPALREDIRLFPHEGGNALIYDPIAHRYHEITARIATMLTHWQPGARLDALAVHFSALLGETITHQDLLPTLTLFDQANVFVEPLKGWKSVFKTEHTKRRGITNWLLHNYLYFRFPLIHPDAFLQRTLPHIVRLATSGAARFGLGLLALAALYMVSRQWDQFTHTFLHFFSLEGAAGYLASLIFLKVLHEFGHGYMARYYGCRIPTMGVAVMVLTPVLYTDVTDAWRLTSRKARLMIGSAGMMVEIVIAIIASFLWAFLPEGVLKSACFFIATTSWLMSIMINLNPLMRFDGYYLLADFWGIANLQSRAIRLMQWKLREVLFALGEPCPEDLPVGMHFKVLVYGAAVVIYRFFLFVGIAVMVYYATFKLLGLLLFGVEILWFILRPLKNELSVWWEKREAILAQRRVRVTSGLVLGFMMFTLIPWPHRIEVPAVLEPIVAQRVAVSTPARILAVHVTAGQHVTEGDVLFRLESPKLEMEMRAVKVKLDLAETRYSRRGASQQERESAQAIFEEITKHREKLASLEQLREELVLRAKVSGTVRDLPRDLHADRWVGRGEELASIVASKGHQVRGYLPELYLQAVKTGAEGVFIPDEPLRKTSPVTLSSIAANSAATIDLPYLVSTQGGPIAVNETREKGAQPVEAQYQVVMHSPPMPEDLPVTRGLVRLEANPQSMAMRTFNRIASILIRESGF